MSNSRSSAGDSSSESFSSDDSTSSSSSGSENPRRRRQVVIVQAAVQGQVAQPPVIEQIVVNELQQDQVILQPAEGNGIPQQEVHVDGAIPEPGQPIQPRERQVRRAEAVAEGDQPLPKRRKRSSLPKLKLGKKKGRKVIRSLSRGLLRDNKSLRRRFLVSFKSHGRLRVPSMDDAIYQRLMKVKRSKASKGTIDQSEKFIYKVQQKILLILNPLLALAEENFSVAQRKAVKNALALTYDAFYETSHLRRLNILHQTSPSFEYLLENPKNLDEESIDWLFGPAFIRLICESNKLNTRLEDTGRDDQVLNRQYKNRLSYPEEPRYRNAYGNGQYATQSNSQRGGHNENGQITFGNFHNQIGYGFSTDPQPGTSRDYQQQPFQGQHYLYNHPPANGHQQQSYHGDEIRERYVTTIHNAPLNAQRMKYYKSNWSAISNDPWIQSIVSEGFRLDFISLPEQRFLPAK